MLEERRFQCGIVASRSHLEDILLDGSRQVCSERVFVREVLIGVAFPGRAPGGAVGAGEDALQCTLRHRQFRAVAACRRGETEIRVGQHLGHGPGAAEGVGEHAEQLFHFRRAHVRLLAEEVVDVVGELRQTRLGGDPRAQRVLADAQQFGIEEGRRRQHLPEDALRLPGRCRRRLVIQVNRMMEVSVDEHLAEAAIKRFYCIHCLGQRRRASAQVSLECLDRVEALQDVRQLRFPLSVGREHARRVPGVLFGNFITRRNFSFSHQILLENKYGRRVNCQFALAAS